MNVNGGIGVYGNYIAVGLASSYSVINKASVDKWNNYDGRINNLSTRIDTVAGSIPSLEGYARSDWVTNSFVKKNNIGTIANINDSASPEAVRTHVRNLTSRVNEIINSLH